MILSITAVKSQEETPFISFEVPSQNLLKFNRFLINPTFSTVRENNSYINLYHRNQWVQFEDSPEIYLASYSGRIGDRTGLGLGVYQQKLGVISNFGILANYAYGVRLAEKSNLTFGFNLSFFSSGLDGDEVISGEIDPVLLELNNSSLLSFQPGFNLSLGSFDVGFYAENLVDFNLRTSESLTDFSEKTFSGHLMYTRRFEKQTGILEDGRLSVLTRARKQGDRDINLSGSLIADLPKLGWIQAGYDDFFGASAGIGFNLTKRLSLGYTIEKGFNDQTENLGPTHEITFAYSFQPNLTEDRVMLEEEAGDELAQMEQQLEEKDELIADKDEELSRIRKNLKENNKILAELIIKQDSMEKAVTNDIERRFYHLIKSMKNDPKIDRNTAIADRTAASGKARVYNTSYAKEKKDFIKAAKANNIRQQTLKAIQGVKGGYYIIANVYSQSKKGNYYRNRFIETLGTKGLDASFFKNPENNLNYVYLQRYDTWQEALDAYKSDLNGAYRDDIWIMSVEGGAEIDRGMLAENDTDTPEIVPATPQNRRITTPVARSEVRIPDTNREQRTKETERISSPVVASQTTNTPDITNDEPKQEEEPAVRRVSSPIVTPNLATEQEVAGRDPQKDADTRRITTPVKNKTVAQQDMQSPVAQGIEDKTEEEIKNIYSQSTRKKRRTAKKGKIINIASLDDGYYIIANVFAVPSNATRFVQKLRNQGIQADYFINPENNYRYVYLKKHESWNSALVSYYSNINDSYFDEMWIMRVNTNYVL